MKETEGALERMTVGILKAVETFSGAVAVSEGVLDNLSTSDPTNFFAAGVRIAGAVPPSDGSHYLFMLLAKDKRLTNWLLDTRACTVKEAATVASAAAEARVQLQATFEMALNKTLQNQPSLANSNRILRTMDLLEAIGGQSCWNAFQVELMAYPDKVVRSKAALLIGRGHKNTTWIIRRLLDRDPRVQANAVETLWGLDAEEAKPHLLDALKSKHGRVFANAALGLYRLGEPSIIVVLLEATKHPDPAIQISALWAIGQSQDPRFLPALSLQFKAAKGKLRLAIGGAISRIRQREKTGGGTRALHIDISCAAAQAKEKRRLEVVVSCHPAKNLGDLKATEFLIWENEILVEDFQVSHTAPADVFLTGFVAPWIESASDPFEQIVRGALKQCLPMKRHADFWRIDRYAVAASAGPDQSATVTSPEESSPPYDDAVVTPHIRAALGCVGDESLLRKIIDLAVPANHAATNGISALERQCKAICQRPGRRHVFILLHQNAGADRKQDATSAVLQAHAKNNVVVFHGIAVGAAGQWPLLRELCLSTPEGSFTETNEAGLADALIRAYACLCSKFQLTYSPPPSSAAGGVKPALKLKIASQQGTGAAEITLDLPPSAPPANLPTQADSTAVADSPPAPEKSAA